MRVFKIDLNFYARKCSEILKVSPQVHVQQFCLKTEIYPLIGILSVQQYQIQHIIIQFILCHITKIYPFTISQIFLQLER